MRTSNGVPDEIADAAARLSGPFSVYVHIPFCLRKCPYCSFYSMPVEEHDRDRYLALAEREIRRFGELLPRDNCAVSTVYVGGGTPTLLSPGEWDVLFGLLKGFLSFFPSAEITAEANPESFSEGHTEVWKKWGVARVSLGVQSFSDADLHWLDRPHDADRARWALKKAVAAGFSVSADLMFGLRGQNLRGWKSSVSEAIGLGVHHISLYQLSIDEGCRWSMNPPEDLPTAIPCTGGARVPAAKRFRSVRDRKFRETRTPLPAQSVVLDECSCSGNWCRGMGIPWEHQVPQWRHNKRIRRGS